MDVDMICDCKFMTGLDQPETQVIFLSIPAWKAYFVKISYVAY